MNRNTFCLRVGIVGFGRRIRTFIFEFKARRAASCTIPKLVAVEGVEPSSLDYQSSTLPLSYTAMVDPGQDIFDCRLLIDD